MGLLLSGRSLSLEEEGAAFLAAAMVGKSYKVETTGSIVSLWRDLQGIVPLEDDLSFISSILVTGRIMDFKADIGEPDRIPEMVNTMTQKLKANVEGDPGREGIIAAFLTAAYISETSEIESTTTIVELWGEILQRIKVEEDEDLIPALLTVGRISELKRPVLDLGEIFNILDALKDETKKAMERRDIRVKNRDIVTAHMASTLIGVSPKVERIKDAVNTWLAVREALDVHEDEDLVSVILATGRIRDLDAMHMVRPDSLSDLVRKIKDKVVSTE